MATPDRKGGKSRWIAAQESTFALASKCEQFAPDGITIYLFSGKFKCYENVTVSKVTQIFQENDPSGSMDLAAVLKHATDDYFDRKAAKQTKPNSETMPLKIKEHLWMRSIASYLNSRQKMSSRNLQNPILNHQQQLNRVVRSIAY
nr:hypothetical protein [Chroococcidiopsis cubana]